jgi:carotenoid cleavage dioxygenase
MWAGVLALIISLVLGFKNLKRGFLMDWGTLLFFLVVVLNDFIFGNHWFSTHADMVSNLFLAVLIWFTLAIRKPFTMQYAKLKVPEEHWNTEIFIHINYIITLVWAVAMTITALPALFDFIGYVNYHSWWNGNINWIVMVAAIKFTGWFPDKYKEMRGIPTDKPEE